MRALGYQILDRNWVCRRKELDIVALDPSGAGGSPLLVFVEVKSRLKSRHSRSMLFDNITAKKQVHLRTLACTYIRKNRFKLSRQFAAWPPPFRIDVIGVIFETLPGSGQAALSALEHLKGAVYAGDFRARAIWRTSFFDLLPIRPSPLQD